MSEEDYENEPAFIGGDAETVRKWQESRLAELERENFAQSDLIRSLQTENEELRAEVATYKRLAGKKAI